MIKYFCVHLQTLWHKYFGPIDHSSRYYRTEWPKQVILRLSTSSDEAHNYTLTAFQLELGKGQGAKEIGYDLGCERPKFGHNSVRKRQKIGHSLERERPGRAHFYAWTTKIWAQSRMRTKRDLGTILWAINKNMGTNLKKQKQQLCGRKNFNSGRVLCKSSRAQRSSGREPDNKGRTQHPQKYA